MTDTERNILYKFVELGVRFYLTGGYVLRKYHPYRDIDVVVHPDDESIVIGTQLGISRFANGGSRYLINKPDTHVDIFFQQKIVVDYDDPQYFDVDEYGFKVVKKIMLLKFYMDFPHVTYVSRKQQLETIIYLEEGVDFMISVSKLLAKSEAPKDGQPAPSMQYAFIRFEVCDNGVLLSVEQPGTPSQRILCEGNAEDVQAKIVTALPNIIIS
jgi:hypothetical protein